MSKLIDTTYAAGPLDELKVVDVYQAGSSSIVNSYQEKGSGAVNLLDKVLGGTGKQISSLLKKAMSIVKTPLNLSGAAQIEKLSNGSTDLSGGLKSLSSGIVSAMNVAPSLMNSVNAVLGSKVTKINFSNISDVRQMANLANTITGGSYKPSINDVGGQASMIAGIVNQGSRMGLPNLFSVISGKTTDKNVIMRAMTSIVPSLVKNVDIPLLNDIASTPYVKQVAKVLPSAVGLIAKVMGKPLNMQQNQMLNYYNTTVNSFDRVQPRWDTYNRGATTSVNGCIAGNNKFYQQMVSSKLKSTPLRVVLPDDQTNYGPNVFSSNSAPPVDSPDPEAFSVMSVEAEREGNEKFMALMDVFPVTNVQDELKKNFPFFSPSLDTGQTRLTVIDPLRFNSM